MLKILAKNTPIFITFLILAWQIIPNFRFYSRPFNRKFLEKLYSESQYVIGEVSKGGIGDDGLYAFAGDYYFRGGDITKVNFENPPLGKYLIGLSIRIFNNENMIYLFYLFIILIFVYKLIILISKNKKMAFLTVFLLLVDKTFRLQYLPQDATQLSITLLDLPLLMFVLLGIYFMLLKTRGGYLLSSLFLGLAVSTKFFPAIILFVTLFIYWVYVSHRQSLRIYLSSLILIPMVYLLSHLNFFLNTPSLIEFIKYQKWILSWRMGNPRVFANIFANILLGHYKSWDARNVLVESNIWSPTLSLVFILFILSIFLIIGHRKQNFKIIFIYTLCITYLIYIVFLTTGLLRYILPIYPLIYFLAVFVLFYVYQGTKKLLSKKVKFK